MNSVPVQVRRVATTTLPCRHGQFDMIGFVDDSGLEHVMLSKGINVAGGHEQGADPGSHGPDDNTATKENLEPLLLRVHSECLTGDAFGSWRCDCGDQLEASMSAIAAAGRGAVIYLRGHEGRGIGLAEKLRAYELQDAGLDTVEANLALGHAEDERSYAAAAAILAELGITEVVLLSGNPAKQDALTSLGVVVVGRRNLAVPRRAENERYLETKRARMHHDPAVVDGTGTANSASTSNTTESVNVS